MQCTNPQVALLSDFEVYQFMSEEGLLAPVDNKDKNARRKEPKSLMYLRREVAYYFEKINKAAPNWTEDQVVAFMRAIQPFKLYKGEKLRLLNVRPKNLVALLLCVDEADERYTPDEQAEMLRILQETLPVPDIEGDEDDMAVDPAGDEAMAIDEY
ncbi:hypothetical protein AMAG_10381 [Allomyces macrogynus ATCC 38327]|uniref:DNA-directed RNA polymerase III subunit RPC9 n=1 Tax=Allomyces macrogynus (strain ATCC 38327) TaxID=578462 RepID=A0A0L0SUX0_ALLM3|nr:hypothetical protein AMAG_10381 [Allomyces macrogynus ATCC 38327]|eukprot:KNE66129.1 hypothetical protein AMAG_10381 [Allomyces macrogynus ATCC 38327]